MPLQSLPKIVSRSGKFRETLIPRKSRRFGIVGSCESRVFYSCWIRVNRASWEESFRPL
jgi:hypothetical protein